MIAKSKKKIDIIISCSYTLLLLLRHVFPIAARHVVELFAGIHALADANGLEVCAPKVLHQTVVAADDIVVEFAVGKAERQRSLILERYAHGIGRAVVMVAIMPFGIVEIIIGIEMETIINIQEPTVTSICVRNPAERFFRSRSAPIMPPRSMASKSRTIKTSSY